MGIQITTQPQVLKTDTVIIGSNNSNNLSAVSGITVYGDVSASGVFRGDGSKLTGLVATGISGISLVNSIDGLTGTVTNAYVPLSGGKTITGSLTSTGNLVLSSTSLTAASGLFTGSISAVAVSGTHYGDGSNLTGVKINSINNLSGGNIIGNTGVNLSSASLTAVSGLFTGSVSAGGIYYGDGSKLTGIVATGISGISLVNSIDGLTGTVTNAYIPLTGGKTITGSLTSTGNLVLSTGSLSVSTVSANNIFIGGINADSKYTASSIGSTVTSTSASWGAGSTLSGSTGYGFKIVNGNQPRVEGDLVVTGRISALSGATFFNTTFTTTSSLCVINAAPLSQVAFYVGASGTGDIASFYDLDQNIEVFHVGGVNSTFKNVGVKTSAPNKDFTVAGEISSTGSAWFGSVNTHAISGGVTAVSGSFTNNISAASISGTYYGNGSNLTGIVPLIGGKTITGSLTSTGSLILSGGSLSAASLSSTTLTANSATIRTSLSSPAVSADVFYGSAAGLTNISNSLTGAALTANSATIRTSLSTVTVSADNLVVSGYPLQAVSRIYQVGTTAATSTYTLALSDNNNTLTMYVGTSGLIVIPNTITFPVGFQTNIMQLSTGRVLLSAQVSNLFNDMSSFRTFKQYSAATVINLGSLWVAYGALSS